MARLELLTAPAADPVTLAETKLRLRVDSAADDAGLARLITAATRHVEQLTRRALVTQSWALVLDAFPCGSIRVPLPPLVSVESVSYVDADGVTQTLDPSAYLVDRFGMLGQIHCAYGLDWPTTRAQPMAVRVEFTAGYGTADDVPGDVVAAILLMVAHLDQNREAVQIGVTVAELPMGVAALLSPYVVPGVA